MKFFVCFALLAIVATALAAPSSGSPAPATTGVSVAVANQESDAEDDLTRLRKSAYGASSGGSYGGSSGASYGPSSVPSPACPKNYLFSCQPNLAPVPCSAPAHGYGSAGAYSSPVASYAIPNYGVPQQQFYGADYAPQGNGYFY